MATPPNQLLSTSTIFDDQVIRELDPNSERFKDFLSRLRSHINLMTIALNAKDSGYFFEEPFTTGQLVFPNKALSSTSGQTPANRPVKRITVDFGALPNTGTKSVAHGIDMTTGSTFNTVYVYGSASIPNVSFIPIPYASSTAGDIIELDIDATNVNITTASDKTAYTHCLVVFGFIDQ